MEDLDVGELNGVRVLLHVGVQVSADDAAEQSVLRVLQPVEENGDREGDAGEEADVDTEKNDGHAGDDPDDLLDVHCWS